ncbi:trafficking protein particle complex subunit 9-like, partial [Vicugna pacos]|uniref:Trafficking protein particle complex subunit 9-like n=1 Tax=Vicugna pacos TaxID=30538 RepID=A0ABM5D0C9_VICPA
YCRVVEKRIEDFTESLFVLLKSKWLDSGPKNSGDKIPLPYIPFEKEDFMGLDTDSSSTLSSLGVTFHGIQETVLSNLPLHTSPWRFPSLTRRGFCIGALTSSGIHPDTSTDTGRAQNCLSPEDTSDKWKGAAPCYSRCSHFVGPYVTARCYSGSPFLHFVTLLRCLLVICFLCITSVIKTSEQCVPVYCVETSIFHSAYYTFFYNILSPLA